MTISDQNRDSSYSSNDSETEIGDDFEMAQYVNDFKKEVEKKYIASRTNKNFKLLSKLPRSISESRTRIEPNSFNSLEGVVHYDLEAQNAKRKLKNLFSIKNNSPNQMVIDVIKILGSLDERYLESQMNRADSIYFNSLYTVVTEKYSKDLKLKESPRLASSKSRLTVISKKSSQKQSNSNKKRLSKNISSGSLKKDSSNFNSQKVSRGTASTKLMKINSNIYLLNKEQSGKTRISGLSPKNGSITNRSNNNKEKKSIIKGIAQIKSNATKIKNNGKINGINSTKRDQLSGLIKAPKKTESICLKNISKLPSTVGSQNSSERFLKKIGQPAQKTENYFSPFQKDSLQSQIALSKCQLQSLIQHNISKKSSRLADKKKSKEKASHMTLLSGERGEKGKSFQRPKNKQNL